MHPPIDRHGFAGCQQFFRQFFIDGNLSQRRFESTGFINGNALKVGIRVIGSQKHDPIERRPGSQLERIRTDLTRIHIPGMGNHHRNRRFHVRRDGLLHEGIDHGGEPDRIVWIEFACHHRRADV